MSLIAFQHVSKHAEGTLTQCRYQWDKRATNEKRIGKRKIRTYFFLIFWSQFLYFGDITSIFREKTPNAMQYRLKILFKSFLYQTSHLVRLEFAETKCAEFGTVAKLGL